ncbi:MAG: hypothetical protein ACWGNI_05435, partial [Desulfobacterales bacterium]
KIRKRYLTGIITKRIHFENGKYYNIPAGWNGAILHISCHNLEFCNSKFDLTYPTDIHDK